MRTRTSNPNPAGRPRGRRRARRTIAILAALAALAGLVVLVGADFGLWRHDHDGIEVDSRTSAAARVGSRSGPPPGRLRSTWTTQVPGQVTEVAGQLISVRANGIQAYDSKTGKPSWHYKERGRWVNGYTTGSGMVIVNTADRKLDSDRRITSWHTVGIEASTGRVRWASSEHWTLAGPEPNSIGWGSDGAASGTVVVTLPSSAKRLGIDVRTGEQRWTITASSLLRGDACDRPRRGGGGGDGPAVLVALSCIDRNPGKGMPNDTVLYAMVDASSGKPHWIRALADTLGARDDRAPRSVGDVTLIGSSNADGRPEVIGSDGRTLFTAEAGSTCGGTDCTLQVSGRYVALLYHPAGSPDSDRLAIIDPATHEHRVIPIHESVGSVSAAVDWVADRGGHLYRVTPVDIDREDPAFPMMLQRLDLATGKSRFSPLPLQPVKYAIEAVGDDRVLLSLGLKGKTRLVSLTGAAGPGPSVLGGIDPRRWPDGRRLVDGIEPEEGKRPEPNRAMTIVGQRIEHPGASVFSKNGDLISAEVAWVASSEREAATMLGGHDSAHSPGREVLPLSTTTYYRVGRMIIAIDGEAGPSDVQHILANAARLAPPG